MIQRNAIRSWTRLSPAVEVILLGDEEGLGGFASEHGIRHIAGIERNEYGTPLVSSIFHTAAQAARYDRLAYVNADIILMNDFVRAVQRVPFPRYLMVGQRRDLDIDEPLDFSDPHWDQRLRNDAAARGKQNIPWAIDYFVHTRDTWERVPPFAIGRFCWDNWLIYDAVRSESPVIDATEAVTAVHQNHGYTRSPGFVVSDRGSPEIRRNAELCGPGEDYSVYDAEWRLTPTGRGAGPAGLRLTPNRMRYWSRCKRWMRRAVGKGSQMPNTSAESAGTSRQKVA